MMMYGFSKTKLELDLEFAVIMGHVMSNRSACKCILSSQMPDARY